MTTDGDMKYALPAQENTDGVWHIIENGRDRTDLECIMVEYTLF